jgi:hypothetical protein
MNRRELDVGAFSWARIQRLYDADAVVHWQLCEAEGLPCAQEVFTQLFHAEDVNATETNSADEMPSGPNLLSLDSVRGVDYSALRASPFAPLRAAPSGVRQRVALSWGRVLWELTEMSGIALRHVRADREYQHALDEARNYAVSYGIVDDREEVTNHWRDAKSWVVPPVAVSGDLLGGGAGFQLLMGYTRLGNLLGILDREEVKEAQRHLVWVGRESRP